jgi:hypothetical protein
MRRIERKTTGARSVFDPQEKTTMSSEEQQLPKEDFKFSFVKKSDDEYWFFERRPWGSMTRVAARCKECGGMPGFFWAAFNAQGQERKRKRRFYACGDHLNEVLNKLLAL